MWTRDGTADDAMVDRGVLRRALERERDQHVKKSKHAVVFGIASGSPSERGRRLARAVRRFLRAKSTQTVAGTFRGEPRWLSYDAARGIVVIHHPDGRFVSCWRVSDGQLPNLVKRGRL